MKYILISLLGISTILSSCESNNNNNSGADRNEAEVVATDTVGYIPDRVDSILVAPDTVLVTPDTAGVQSEIEGEKK